MYRSVVARLECPSCCWLAKGVRFVAVTQGFDFAGTTGKLIAQFCLALPRWNRRPDGNGSGLGSTRRWNEVFILVERPGHSRRSPSEPNSSDVVGSLMMRLQQLLASPVVLSSDTLWRRVNRGCRTCEATPVPLYVLSLGVNPTPYAPDRSFKGLEGRLGAADERCWGHFDVAGRSGPGKYECSHYNLR